MLAGEIARLRPGRTPPPSPWATEARLADDLGADSLERLQLATALGEAIHLQESGRYEVAGGEEMLARPTFGGWVDAAATSLERFSARVTFRTSGSTGAPKWCEHEIEDLETEAEQIAVLLAGSGRVVTAVPSHHIYGFLWTILAARRLAAPVVDIRSRPPARLAAVLEPGDAVIGYPDFWRAVVRAAPRLPAGVTGVTSTAPSEPEIAANLRAQGLARFIDVYGSSETAGIGWRDDESAPYRLFAPWQRGAGERELQRVLRGGGMRPAVVPDRLVWDDDRHVRPVGRDENGVQVGGVNVFPERVAAVLGAHPDVAQAAVRLMRPDEGRRLKAFVVPREPGADPGALVARLWPWLEERLSAPECPKSIVVGSELPAGVFGKAADWPIPDAAPGVGFPEGHRSL